jgi:hypothetical protein
MANILFRFLKKTSVLNLILLFIFLLSSKSFAQFSAQCSTLAIDCDGDGIPNSTDLDDDNDGIFDTDESCPGTYLFTEDFGTGAATDLPSYSSDGTTSYIYAPVPDHVVDGYYRIDNISPMDFNTWQINLYDHTPSDVDGRMFIVNAISSLGEFYRRSVTVIPNTPTQIEFWVYNVCVKDEPSPNIQCDALPNIKYQIESTATGTIIDTPQTTGDITRTASWVKYTMVINSGANTNIDIVILDNGTFGDGNDLIIDDISVIQNTTYCDTDNDGIPNYLDLDSDNDGCPDADEVYGVEGTDSNGDGTFGGVITPAGVDASGKVLIAGYR